MICKAHENGVRVVARPPKNMPLSGDKSVRAAWIAKVVDLVKENFVDGITFDYESPIPPFSPKAQYYVDIVNETNQALKAINKGYQVSVCAAWSPGTPSGIDGRAYDYLGLAEASDFLYVMQYDVRSQIFDQCVASANCPI